jgi:xanthine/uracil permease
MEKRKWTTEILTSVQWFVFLVANTVGIPILIGEVYHFSPAEITSLMQRSFFLVGVTGFLQGWIGHRLPIIEVPAGIWMGIFFILGSSLASADAISGTLQSLQGQMLLTGIFLLLMGASGLVRFVHRLFPPLVTGTYLFLLFFQLCGVYVTGIVGDKLNGLKMALSIAVMLFVVWITLKGKTWMKNYALLIGMGIGWVLFAIFGLASIPKASGPIFKIPTLMAWGMPNIGATEAITAVCVGLVLLSNSIATIQAMENALGIESKGKRLQRSSVISGISTLFSGFFSTVGGVPISHSAGFVKMTGQANLPPFLWGHLMLIVLSFFPGLFSFVSAIPAPVTYAVMLASVLQIAGISFSLITQEEMNQRRMTIFGLALVVGIGISFLPKAVFATAPVLVRSILGNGLLSGTIVMLLLHTLWNPKKEQ